MMQMQTCQHLKITWSNEFFQNTHISITRSYVTGHDSVAGCYRLGEAERSEGGGGGRLKYCRDDVLMA